MNWSRTMLLVAAAAATGCPSTVQPEEADPVFGASPAAAITAQDVVGWNAVAAADAGFLKQEADPVFASSPAASISAADVVRWNGLADAGFLTSEADPLFSASPASSVTSAQVANWDTAHGWGSHAAAGYLTAEGDPSFNASVASGITGAQVASWNTAASWGDHASQGYVQGSDSRLSDARAPLPGSPDYVGSDGGVVTGDLVVTGSAIRRIQRTVGYGLDGRDTGYLTGRVLNFTKTRGDTSVRITWSDNRRAIGYAYGYWEIYLDGLPCANPGPMRFWHHTYTSGPGNQNDNHYNATIVAHCTGTAALDPLPAGTYAIAIQVHHVGGNNSDWYVGWNGSQFTLEAEEIF